MSSTPRVLSQISRSVRPFRDIPGPPSYPILGTWPAYATGRFNRFKYHEVLSSLYVNYGPLVKEKIGGRKTLVHVFHPDDIQKVYSLEGKWPIVPPLQETTQMYRQQKKMSLGLGNTNGEEWYRLRSNSQQKMLRPKEVQHHLPSVNQIARDFADRLERVRLVNDEVNDLNIEVGKWSLENAGALCFDRRLGFVDDDDEAEDLGRKMVEANKTIFTLSGILKLSLPLYQYFSTPKWRRLVAAEDFFYSNALQMVDDAILRLRDSVESGDLSEERFYLLSYLLSRDELSLKDVAVVLLSLFADSLSTTTPTILFNLYCLSKNQDVQDKIYSQIRDVVGDSKDITQEHINKLSYLKAFIKETFRLYPNGTEISRYTEQPMVLSGYHIPAGTHVDLNPSVHFNDPEIFPEPHRHMPERWLREGSGSGPDIHPYLLTPFGHGTRMCAGRRFAEQDMLVLLSTLLRRFHLNYPFGESIDQIYHTLLFPDRPVRVSFGQRTGR